MSTTIKTPIIQFGTSRFLQAHADFFIHEAAAQGQAAGPVTIVASSGGSSGRDRLAAFNDPEGFPVIVRGLANGKPVESEVRVKSVVRGLDAIQDWRELQRIATHEAEFIISNTTEAGFAVPDGLTLDLSKPLDEAPPSFPARLLALLNARFLAGGTGLVILPTELVGRNGDVLKAIVLSLARHSNATPSLVSWLDEQCVFANSLVDRIVSAPLEPAGAVAEPYALWAIEKQPGLRLPCEHPAIQLVDDLEPVERLKIHVLNLGHTVLAELWRSQKRADDLTVREILADPSARRYLLDLYETEVIPGFAARGMRDAAMQYVSTTMERFDNPFLDHRIRDIASGHEQKMIRRIGGFIDWVQDASGPDMPKLRAVLASYSGEKAA